MIKKTDQSHSEGSAMIVNGKTVTTSDSYVDVDLRGYIRGEEFVGGSLPYIYEVIQPSPVDTKKWLQHETSANYWKDKVVEKSYNYNGLERDVISIYDGSINQIIDKQTGILLLLVNNPPNYDGIIHITKLIDTNIISSSNNNELDKTVKKSSITQLPPKCLGNGLCITAKISKVVDGDTIYLDTGNKIRLSLTNTPDKNQKGFKEATSFTANLCKVGTQARIDQDDKQKTDKYGRIVAKVTCSGKNLNAELLDNGLATISKQYCKKSEFRSEDWAKKYGC